ncbi:MAG TPA: glycerol kinase GlpK [Spirochaetota bacterium]|nr:glycerol kinase GlpK [Spirochaetota bacterium]HOD16724.1 glycerol kinase GlpK [Spirochaetota bacterium]HPG49824.1 glycerol kinase GlpK [Spirochaetota bacterium]HPN13889.1 glycerol kinase GlpK [Spirochaetota bacterium]HQL82608.1 glycerol kinase GlpK [Spirochaetota bacterium]
MGKRFIIAIDLGTTGNRVYCFDEKGLPVSSAYREFTQHFPKPGWVEHDAVEIWDSVSALIPRAIKDGGLSPSDAIAIGITNQRETSLLWDRDTGKPIYNAIVWQCRRTTDICNQLKQAGHEQLFRETTGLVIDAYFSGTKVKWLLDNVQGARTQAESGKLLFGTIDTWILWNLTGGVSHATDYTNASRTLMFDIKEKNWSGKLLEILSVPTKVLPEVKASASKFGVTKGAPGLPDGIVIGGIAGDQQAAMVGQNCVTPGSLKNTYGTGCFMLMNNGENFIISRNGLLTTLACDTFGHPVYALEGSVFIGGAVVQWLRDYLKFFENSAESEKMARSVAKESQVVLVPAFVGLGAPHWNMDARGAMFGLTRDTTREDIVMAALKSIALQSRDLVEAMQEDTGMKVPELRVDGGATKNAFLMQFQSDILNIPVLLPEITESTALGAAYLAGITGGVFGSIGEIAKTNRIASSYKPGMSKSERDHQVQLWNDAIRRLLLQ